MKREKEYDFYWEQPKKKRKIRFEEIIQPIEISFNIPMFESDIPVEMYERDEELIIVAKVPGFRKKEISFKITNNSVEILAKKSEEKVDNKSNVYSKSFYSKTFQKKVSLPYEIDSHKTYSIIEDGEIKIIASKTDYKKKKKIKM
ncbi:MAG: Hsp20/alpha crystallin family protein [Candidatus Aenigmarchaeota archaeon]|nr:Hsp20/alpha crystallin family protein [Candidatus Aenigmarchaeota archaeon]